MRTENQDARRAREWLQAKRAAKVTATTIVGYTELKLPDKECYYWINNQKREVRMGKTFERSSDVTKWVYEGVRLSF